MALNLDTTFQLKAKVVGAKSVDQFKKQLKGLDSSSKLTKVQLGKMNIEINRMARAAGNTTQGLRQHIRALTALRDRTDIGSRAYKRLGTQIDILRKKMKGLDGQALTTGNRLAGMLATVGIGRLIRTSISGASNYEEELKKTAAIEGGGNYKQIEQAVSSTAQIAAGTPQEVATLATSLARAGFDADQISASLNGIVLGAEATSTSFDEMGTIVADNLNSFGLEASDTSSLVDILVASANNANQTVSDLGVSLKYAAPVARSFGLTVNETAATISLMAQAGIRGSDAGTALRTGLTRLQLAASGAEGRLLGVSRGTQQLIKGFTALSSDILEANGQLKPMDEVLIALKRDLEGIEDIGQRAEIVTAIFGKEQGSKFLSLLGRSEQEIQDMYDAVENSADVTNRTREAMASFGLTTKILGGNLQVVTNQIGAAFIKVLEPLAKALNRLLTAATKLPTPVKGLAAALAALGLVALQVKVVMIALNITFGKAVVIAKFSAALAGLKKALVAAKIAMMAFNLTNPVGWIAWAVVGLVALGAALYKFRHQIYKHTIQPLIKLQKEINGLKKVIQFKEFVNENIIKPIREIGEEFRKMIMEKIIAFWKVLPPWLRRFITGSAEAVKNFTVNVVTDVKEFGANILGGGDGTGDGTENKPTQVTQGLISAMEEYRKKAQDVAGQVKDAMGSALQGMEDALVKFVTTGKLAFGDLARSINADITRIVIRSAIISPLLGAFGIKVASAKGNVFEGGEVQKYAYGGAIVNRPTVFPMANGLGLMGEAGAEAIMPLKRGKDGRLGVTAQGGGSTVVNVSVNAGGTSANGNTMKANQLGKLIGSAIEAELIKQKRPGGILYE